MVSYTDLFTHGVCDFAFSSLGGEFRGLDFKLFKSCFFGNQQILDLPMIPA